MRHEFPKTMYATTEQEEGEEPYLLAYRDIDEINETDETGEERHVAVYSLVSVKRLRVERRLEDQVANI